MFSIFDKYPEVIVALSEKKDGSMKFSGNSLEDKKVFENRKFFLNKLGIDINQLVSADLVHGNVVQIVTTEDRGEKIAKTDGLLTAEKNIFLSITVADCLPIFLYDFKNKIIGLVHSGWKSLAKNILSSAIEKLTSHFGTLPQNILAGIGPGICQNHFEVKEDVLTEFKTLPAEISVKKNKKLFLDLKKAAKFQLLNLGLEERNIEINPECTYCLTDKYFSYRRDLSPHLSIGSGEKVLKTMLAVIGQVSALKKY